MGTAVATPEIGFEVSDVSGQKRVKVSNIAPQSTVREFINGAIKWLGLPLNDTSGRPLNYRARSESKGQFLQDSEIVGDALENGEQVVVHPNIDAGACR